MTKKKVILKENKNEIVNTLNVCLYIYINERDNYIKLNLTVKKY
jgi:hypothetical protein